MSSQSHKTLALVSDSPTRTRDLLHFKRYVDPLVKLITNEDTETPFTIGIFGGWGTGKTTLLEMIEEQVREKKYPTVWFNPWMYQTEDNLIVPLLQTIHDSLLESGTDRFKDCAKRMATVVAQISASVLMKTVTMGGVSLEDIEKRMETYNNRHAEALSTIRKLRTKLQEVVNELTDNGQNGRLVIYIDDLDRCVPTKIIGLLEAIKLFLDLKNAIIFMAIDRDIVQQGIQIFYKDFNIDKEKCDPLTADYLDKMIQVPLYLPPIGSDQVGKYIQQLFLNSDLDEYKELFQKCLYPNPRKIKRVLNIYTLSSAIIDSEPRWHNINKSILAKLVIIQQQWSDLYHEIIRYNDLASLLEKVYQGKLQIRRSEEWIFLGNRQDELLRLCNTYYRPTSQLSYLFNCSGSFQDIELEPYLFMLGS